MCVLKYSTLVVELKIEWPHEIKRLCSSMYMCIINVLFQVQNLALYFQITSFKISEAETVGVYICVLLPLFSHTCHRRPVSRSGTVGHCSVFCSSYPSPPVNTTTPPVCLMLESPLHRPQLSASF